ARADEEGAPGVVAVRLSQLEWHRTYRQTTRPRRRSAQYRPPFPACARKQQECCPLRCAPARRRTREASTRVTTRLQLVSPSRNWPGPGDEDPRIERERGCTVGPVAAPRTDRGPPARYARRGTRLSTEDW